MLIVDSSKIAEYRVRFAGNLADWKDLPVVETLFVMDDVDADHMAALVASSQEDKQRVKPVALRWNYQGSDQGHYKLMIAKATKEPALVDLLLLTARAADAKYEARYDNDLYRAAVGDDTQKGVHLSNTALALCGHPCYVVDLSFGNDAAAMAFLVKFA